MCGITGILSQDSLKREKICEATNSLIHRGPDNQNIYMNSFVALGHTRLSIIDIESGNQPMKSLDERYVLVFNGECYNFQVLRDNLISNKVSFKTNSDTEVLLQGLIYEGPSFIEKMNGMFSFAFWDNEEKKLLLGRDRFGEKPLYYYHMDNEFIFGSELKSIFVFGIEKEINNEALNCYLSFTYIPSPLSIYKNIYKLPPGSFLTLFEDSIIVEPYYNLKDQINLKDKIEENNIKTSLFKTLEESVRLRMIADVPVGAFLSGGIDSSIIVGLMSKLSDRTIDTFNIGFEDPLFDESLTAQKTAEYYRTNHTSYILKFDDFLHDLDNIIYHFDEPFADSSAIPTSYVCKLASKKLKVVLTGDCADELFGGYNKYQIDYYRKILSVVPGFLKSFSYHKLIPLLRYIDFGDDRLSKFQKVLRASTEKTLEGSRYSMICMGFNNKERKKALNSQFYSDYPENCFRNLYNSVDVDDMTRLFYTDVRLVLEGDMLAKVDRMSMYHSIETRIPFLDPLVVSLAFQIPSSLKIKGKVKKYILKETFSKMLPSHLNNLPKKGFSIPIGNWLRNELRSKVNQYLSRDYIESMGIFHAHKIEKIVNLHLANKYDYSSILWTLYIFSHWYSKNFNK